MVGTPYGHILKMDLQRTLHFYSFVNINDSLDYFWTNAKLLADDLLCIPLYHYFFKELNDSNEINTVFEVENEFQSWYYLESSSRFSMF